MYIWEGIHCSIFSSSFVTDPVQIPGDEIAAFPNVNRSRRNGRGRNIAGITRLSKRQWEPASGESGQIGRRGQETGIT